MGSVGILLILRVMELTKRACLTSSTTEKLAVFSMSHHMLLVLKSTSSSGKKILKKEINIRVEHIKHSSCRQDFLDRVKRNEILKKEAKEKGIKVNTKRQAAQPRKAHFVSTKLIKPEFLAPIPYEIIA